MKQTKNRKPIIAVSAGKGGTGKTLVATNLALAAEELAAEEHCILRCDEEAAEEHCILRCDEEAAEEHCILRCDEEVQFLDCDVEEPNAYIFLKPQLQNTLPVELPLPVIDREKCTGCGKCADFCEFNALAVVKNTVVVFNELCHSCGGCMLVCPEDAITETTRQIGVVEIGSADGMPVVDGVLNVGEALAPPIITAVKEQARPDLTTIIDSPPGTACPMIETVKGADYCIMVTEPTPFGYHDLTIAVGVAQELDVPYGVIVNRANIGDDQVYKYCEEENIPILMEIPMDRKIAEAYSDGISLIEAIPEYKEKFAQLFRKVVTQLSEIT